MEKQKAKDLIEKHKPFVYCYLGSGMLSNTIDDDVILMMAKKCAHITVDEILESYFRDYELRKDKTYWHPYDYWLKVKNEIDNVK